MGMAKISSPVVLLISAKEANEGMVNDEDVYAFFDENSGLRHL